MAFSTFISIKLNSCYLEFNQTLISQSRFSMNLENSISERAPSNRLWVLIGKEEEISSSRVLLLQTSMGSANKQPSSSGYVGVKMTVEKCSFLLQSTCCSCLWSWATAYTQTASVSYLIHSICFPIAFHFLSHLEPPMLRITKQTSIILTGSKE